MGFCPTQIKISSSSSSSWSWHLHSDSESSLFIHSIHHCGSEKHRASQKRSEFAKPGERQGQDFGSLGNMDMRVFVLPSECSLFYWDFNRSSGTVRWAKQLHTWLQIRMFGFLPEFVTSFFPAVLNRTKPHELMSYEFTLYCTNKPIMCWVWDSDQRVIFVSHLVTYQRFR